MKSLVISMLLFLPVSVCAQALFLKNNNGRVDFDESNYPANVKPGIALLNSKCESCHSLTRIISAIETGHTRSGLPFDESGVRQFVIRKMRRPDVKLNGQQAGELLRALQYMLGQSTPVSQGN